MVAKSSDFTKYLLAEYEYIAEAHFKTIEAISSFFRYYLIIMGLPFTLYAAIVALSPQIGAIIYTITALTGMVSLIISVVGFLVTLYIINLRFDAILYARTVNGIRKHFYDQTDIDPNVKLRMRPLPQTPTLPAYFETFFLPVVISFAVFDFVYFFLGLVIFKVPLPNFTEITSVAAISTALGNIPPIIWVPSIAFFALHVGAYAAIAASREESYLKSYSIGIDIDGVLNYHREHFCKLLEECTKKKLDPKDIIKIPVHEEPSHGVTEQEAKVVFNCSKYWIEMPGAKDAADNIRRLRNGLKLKVFIFTYRHSPNESINEQAKKDWSNAALEAYRNAKQFAPKRARRLLNSKEGGTLDRIITKLFLVRLEFKNTSRFGIKPVDIITKYWLEKEGVEYDVLTIEKGNDVASDPRGEFKNRFFISREKKIKFFVEDDPEKATKLAFICDVVFLIDHPYNQENTENTFPANVIRVKDWNDLYQKVRKYS